MDFFCLNLWKQHTHKAYVTVFFFEGQPQVQLVWFVGNWWASPAMKNTQHGTSKANQTRASKIPQKQTCGNIVFRTMFCLDLPFKKQHKTTPSTNPKIGWVLPTKDVCLHNWIIDLLNSKNHGISKLMVWRSQNPPIESQTHVKPLHRRVQWFLGKVNVSPQKSSRYDFLHEKLLEQTNWCNPRHPNPPPEVRYLDPPKHTNKHILRRYLNV